MCEHIPYLILPVRQLSREPFGIRRSAASEPSGKMPGPSRFDHCVEVPRASRRARWRNHLIEPSAEAIHEQAIGQDAGPVSIRTIRQSATSEPSGKMQGPSQSGRSTEAPRSSHRARRRAHLIEPAAKATHEQAVGQPTGPVSNHPLKRQEGAVWQDARPASNHPPKRYTSELSGNMPGPSQSGRSAEAPQASRRAIRRARLDPNHSQNRYTSDPSTKLLSGSCVRSGTQATASWRHRYRTEPLRLFAVNPLTVGELGRVVMWGVIPI